MGACMVATTPTPNPARMHTPPPPPQGLHACLIDFTASRLCCGGGRVAYCDLAQDPELFEGTYGHVQVRL